MFRPYRLLITGSRTWTDSLFIASQIEMVWEEIRYGPLVVIHGDCPEGADFYAKQWVLQRPSYVATWTPEAVHRTGGTPWVTQEPHPADWSRHGRKAGFVRNAGMVKLGANECLAFAMPCTKPECRLDDPHDSHGTAHCAGLSEGAGIPTTYYRPCEVGSREKSR